MTQPAGPPLPPPPPPMPQVFFPPPALYPQPARGGFARALFTTLAVSIFGLSLTLNVYLLVASGLFGGNSGGIHKSTLVDGDTKSTVAILPITGAINANTVADVNAMLKQIEADTNVKAVVLEINSPGGEVTASDELYSRILRLKKDHGWPVVVSMGALATSGGYYISCAADQIVAQRTTWTGNIGVLIPRMNFSGLAQKYGVNDNTIKSTGSDFKDATSSFKPDTPKNEAYFQKLADDTFAVFKQVVVTGRGLTPAVVDGVANGKVYLGPEAMTLKLVDQIGYLDDAVTLASDKAGLTGVKTKVVRYEKSRGLFESFAGGSLSLPEGKVPSVNVSIDRALLDDVLSPRPMYLWRGQ